ncbi:class I SAM-dependent methyltransferase [Ornithinimicrobium panacihumi]|uniref:class I SAM-dependent methyltransferase n=1 Tax=Ornithinimicrobium panacihumi TaxID=2008449 RepID=UPI003F891B72
MRPRPIDPALLEWYTHVEDETTRLVRAPHNRVELLRTREVVGRFLDGTGPMGIVDVGGGSGVHAGWLAEQGHRVTLLDPVPRHVEAAARLPGVEADLGDGRDLPYPDDSFDLGLALGPLYHLADRAERVEVLRELARVVRPGGAVLAAAIGRYAVLGEFVLDGAFEGPQAENLLHYVRTGENLDEDGFPVRHAHLSDELFAEAQAAGWIEVGVIGLEGPLGIALDLLPQDRVEAAVAQAVRMARILESDDRALDLSLHLLVFGRVLD